MISKELSATLGFAVREAKKRRHEYVSIEHIFLQSCTIRPALTLLKIAAVMSKT